MNIIMRIVSIRKANGDIRTMLIEKSQFDDGTPLEDFIVQGRESIEEDLGFVNIEVKSLSQEIALEGVFEQTL